MSVSYGGVYLSGCSDELANHIEQRFSFKDVFEFEDWTSTPCGMCCLTWPGYYQQNLRPIKVGTLWWPQGAMRWGRSHWVVDANTLDAIRTLAFPGGVYTGLPLVLTGRQTVTAQKMWMLPARQIGNETTLNPFALLTLVDARYFYWSCDTGQISPQTDWTAFINALVARLGTTPGGSPSLTIDTIPSAYNFGPADSLVVDNWYVPPLLDGAAYDIGMRCCFSLAGALKFQNATTAATVEAAQVAGQPVLLGGTFLLDG